MVIKKYFIEHENKSYPKIPLIVDTELHDGFWFFGSWRYRDDLTEETLNKIAGERKYTEHQTNMPRSLLRLIILNFKRREETRNSLPEGVSIGSLEEALKKQESIDCSVLDNFLGSNPFSNPGPELQRILEDYSILY